MAGFLDDMIDGNLIKQKPWMAQCEFILGTAENLATCVDACISNGRFGLDLETSGLDSRVKLLDGKRRTIDVIAGACISPDGIRGYYFPLHHRIIQRDGSKTPHPANLSIQVFAVEFKRLMDAVIAKKTIAIFHHGKFDQEFLEFNETGEPWGNWDLPKTWDDTMILGYLRNSRCKNRRLKDMSAAPPDAREESQTGGPGLGMEMFEIYELWGHDKYQKGFIYDFTTLDPTEPHCLWYAGSDAICTYRLRDLLYPCVANPDSDGQTQMTIYTFEKACVSSVRWMERCRLHLDKPRILELIQVGQKEWFEAIQVVYAEAEKLLGRDVTPGYYRALKTFFNPNDPNNLLDDQINQAKGKCKHNDEFQDIIAKRVGKDGKEWPVVYDVKAPQQLGVMFEEMDVPGLKFTEKSGQVATSKDEIERIINDAGEQFPFMDKIRWFREIQKALSTYLNPFYLQSDPEDDTGRINFRQDGTDTGRFATPSKDESSDDFMVGWPKVNVHSIPKAGDGDKHPECLNRVRECISCRPPSSPDKPRKYMAAIDLSGEELRIITNLSHEPKWLKEFFHCTGCDRMFPAGDGSETPEAPPTRCPNCGSDKIGDIHTITGLAIYGQDANSRPDWKELRGHAKGLNFAMCYGGGGSAAMRSTGVDKQEGWRIKHTFDRTYPNLKAWWDVMHAFARQHGFIRTAFGRRYPLPDINSPDGGFRSGAERNAINGPVQGSAADMIKIAMTLIYREMRDRGWLEKVMMVMTMHDELVFEIDADVLEEALALLAHIMTRNSVFLGMKWPIPYTCDVEIGHDWTVPWHMTEMKYGEIRFIGNKKYKNAKKIPEGFIWDQMQRYPDELKPWLSDARGENPLQLPPPPVTPTPEPIKVAEPIQVTEPIQVSDPSTPVVTEQVAPAPVRTVAELTLTPIQGAPIPASAERRAAVSDLPVEVAAVTAGGVFEYRLNVPLTVGTMIKLADVIHQCQNRGMATLKLFSRTGESLDSWTAGREIRVSPTTFYVLAKHFGI